MSITGSSGEIMSSKGSDHVQFLPKPASGKLALDVSATVIQLL
jgi:hypothetical protein